MKAGDIMSREVISIGPDEPVREIARLMLARRISGVPVVDPERRVLGVVSEGDLIRRPELETDQVRGGWLSLFVSEDERARDFIRSHGLKASEVMTRPALCVTPDAPLAEVVRLLERHRIKRLPVTENGRLVGLLTRADLLRALATQQAAAPAGLDDRQLRMRIDELLRTEAWAASAIVNAQVENGVAQLWGTVESPSQRDALILAVRGIPGIRDVEAHLGRLMAG
jgi:CBS domain-containing protein